MIDDKQLDEAHSTLVTAAEQGRVSEVLTTIASVLGSLSALDTAGDSPNYWHDVIVNLNTLADEYASPADDADQVTGDDWDLIGTLDELEE